MTLVFVVFGLGLAAGALTTVAGMGGGLMLLLSLSLLLGPAPALAATAPALLVGNLHRTWMFRSEVNWSVARAFALGAVPGALLGAGLAVSVPPALISGLMVLITLLSVVRALGKFQLRAPPGVMTPAGFLIGGLTGSAGGAAVLTSPLFLSTGLVGEAYTATTAVSAVAMHLGRIAGYGAGGLFTREVWQWAAVLALAVVAGNNLGRRVRKLTRRVPEGIIEHSVLVLSVVLALSGLAHR
ncbi:MAG: sulfite exporter TauE/SafE family protein [Myxococcales bacterium]|nr:sulfite exporter TauE/SafE family protein [Myxococcales bacterium]